MKAVDFLLQLGICLIGLVQLYGVDHLEDEAIGVRNLGIKKYIYFSSNFQ